MQQPQHLALSQVLDRVKAEPDWCGRPTIAYDDAVCLCQEGNPAREHDHRVREAFRGYTDDDPKRRNHAYQQAFAQRQAELLATGGRLRSDADRIAVCQAEGRKALEDFARREPEPGDMWAWWARQQEA